MDVALFCMLWNISVMLTSEIENECKGKGNFAIRLCLFKFLFLKGSRGIWFIASKVWKEMGLHCEEPNNWIFHRRRQRNARTSAKVTWTFVSYPLPPISRLPKGVTGNVSLPGSFFRCFGKLRSIALNIPILLPFW